MAAFITIAWRVIGVAVAAVLIYGIFADKKS